VNFSATWWISSSGDQIFPSVYFLLFLFSLKNGKTRCGASKSRGLWLLFDAGLYKWIICFKLRCVPLDSYRPLLVDFRKCLFPFYETPRRHPQECLRFTLTSSWCFRQDSERTREVYKACLEVIPHKKFTFAKVWIMFAHFEIRQKDVTQARKILVCLVKFFTPVIFLFVTYSLFLPTRSVYVSMRVSFFVFMIFFSLRQVFLNIIARACATYGPRELSQLQRKLQLQRNRLFATRGEFMLINLSLRSFWVVQVCNIWTFFVREKVTCRCFYYTSAFVFNILKTIV